jgi:Uma2 family endonuclease
MAQLTGRQRPLRRSEYERLVAAGVFKNERLELIRGVIVRKSPQDPPDATAVQILSQLLVLALQRRADVRVQLPFAASDDSLPEPDLAVVDRMAFGAPHPSSAHLIIEVADSSLEDDRHEKAALYADAGVREYWIVNIPDRLIEVRTESGRGGYLRVTPYRPGEAIALLAFPDVQIAVAAVFDADR